MVLALADYPAVLDHLLGLQARLKDGGPDATMLSVDDARAYVKKHRGRGCDCPSCGQRCKIYPRPITHEMVGCLFQAIAWYVKERDWIEGKRFKRRGGDYAKLSYWGLIEFETVKADKRRQSGRVRPTKLGVQFALMQVSVPYRVLVFNSNVIGVDSSESIWANGVEGFDYAAVSATVDGAEDLPW
jgi:hypothetical protein